MIKNMCDFNYFKRRNSLLITLTYGCFMDDSDITINQERH